jgi:hypothetical protein
MDGTVGSFFYFYSPPTPTDLNLLSLMRCLRCIDSINVVLLCCCVFFSKLVFFLSLLSVEDGRRDGTVLFGSFFLPPSLLPHSDLNLLSLMRRLRCVDSISVFFVLFFSKFVLLSFCPFSLLPPIFLVCHLCV